MRKERVASLRKCWGEFHCISDKNKIRSRKSPVIANSEIHSMKIHPKMRVLLVITMYKKNVKRQGADIFDARKMLFTFRAGAAPLSENISRSASDGCVEACQGYGGVRPNYDKDFLWRLLQQIFQSDSHDQRKSSKRYLEE